MINDFIKSLRNKPDKTKIKILWATGAISIVFVFAIWVSTFENYKIAFDNMLGDDVGNLAASFSEPITENNGYEVGNYTTTENYISEEPQKQEPATQNKAVEVKPQENDILDKIIMEEEKENNNSVRNIPMLPVE